METHIHTLSRFISLLQPQSFQCTLLPFIHPGHMHLSVSILLLCFNQPHLANRYTIGSEYVRLGLGSLRKQMCMMSN